MTIIILILSWTTLTAQNRDDRIAEVIGDYISIVSNQSNVIYSLERELLINNKILTNHGLILDTVKENHKVDIKLEKIKADKKLMVGIGIGSGLFAVIGGLLKYTFSR